MTKLLKVALCAGVLWGIAACEEKRAEAPPPAVVEKKPHAATPVEPPKPAEAAATHDDEPPAGPHSPGELQDGFKADKSKWLRRKVIVDGLYMNTNTAKSGEQSIVNIVVVQERGKFEPSVTCYLKDAEPPKLMQYDAVRIEGKVREGFGAQLEGCVVTKR